MMLADAQAVTNRHGSCVKSAHSSKYVNDTIYSALEDVYATGDSKNPDKNITCCITGTIRSGADLEKSTQIRRKEQLK